MHKEGLPGRTHCTLRFNELYWAKSL